MNPMRWVSGIGQDLRHAMRVLGKDRWFAFAAAVALALGVGMTGTMFTIVNAMIRGLPVERPDRIVSVHTRDAAGRWRGLGVSYQDFQDFRAAARTCSGLAAFSQMTVSLDDEGRAPERSGAAFVSANAFEVLGNRPIIGRGFVPGDDRRGASPVVMLGSRIWNERYHADSTVVGRSIRVNGVPSTVIGVMPDGFRFPVVSDVWQPLGLLPGLNDQTRDARVLQVFGRLADGSTRAQAQAELANIAERLSREYPGTNRQTGVVVVRFPPHFAPDAILVVLMAAVGFVLLVACANVASLLLTRSTTRAAEMFTRVALGATRWRIVRQLLVESALVTAIAGTLGLAFALAGVRLFSDAVSGITFPYYIQWTVDRRVIAFLAAACFGAGFLAGVPSGMQSWRLAATASTQDRGTLMARLRTRGWTTVLLTSELALTLILLAAAGLMLRSFLIVYRADRIVDASHVLTMPLTLPAEKYRTREQRVVFYRTLQERLAAAPRVSSVALANAVPFGGGPSRRITIAGRPSLPADAQMLVSYVTIRGRYFETLGLRLLRGRTFEDLDEGLRQSSAIVNQRLAAMFFPNEDPIGRRICLSSPAASTSAAGASSCATVVGVSPTVRQQYFQDIDPVVYVPDRADDADMMLMVRGDPVDAIAPVIRAETFALDRAISVNAMTPLDRFMTQSRWGHRVFGGMLTVFALVSLALAAIGLYAVTAYSVVQRTREIGVRMALGAPPRTVVWLFQKRMLLPLGAGLAVGFVGAVAVGRLLRSFLIQTSSTDAATLLAVTAILVAVSTMACLLPARRAARLDPVSTLRYE